MGEATKIATEHAVNAEMAGLVERVREAIPTIRQHSPQGDKERRVPDTVIDTLDAAGVFQLGTPKRFGGHEASAKDFLDIVSTVSEADGGTGWISALVGMGNWVVGTFGKQAQEEVYGANPKARVTGVVTPTATTKRVEGGLRVTGKWYYNSGGWHTDWLAVGIPVVDEDGQVIDQGIALIPRTETDIEDTWYVAGMRSSGSICIVVDDVFVPDHRITSVPAAVVGQYDTEFKDESAYRMALSPLFSLVLAGPQLGMGRAALEFVRSKAENKPIAYTFMTSQADSVAFQLQITEAALLIDTAHLLAYKAAEIIDDAAAAGVYPEVLDRAKVRAYTGRAIESVTKAIDILVSAHGAGSFAEVSPLQRIWRDSNVGARHAVIMPIINYEIYGKALMGKDNITPLL